jgi:hypothetical protein
MRRRAARCRICIAAGRRRPCGLRIGAAMSHARRYCGCGTLLSRIEHGHRRLTIDEIAGFARLLGHSIAVRWTPLHDTGEDVDPTWIPSAVVAVSARAWGPHSVSAPRPHPQQHVRSTPGSRVSGWSSWVCCTGTTRCSDRATWSVRSGTSLASSPTNRQLARGKVRTDLLRVESRWSLFASWLAHDAGGRRTRDY